MSDYEKKLEKMENELLEEEMEDDVWELEDEEGNAANFYLLATLEHEDKWYVVFQPCEESEDISEDELVIFELDSDQDDNDVFKPIEDEEILNKVYDEYVKLCDMEEGEEDETESEEIEENTEN